MATVDVRGGTEWVHRARAADDRFWALERYGAYGSQARVNRDHAVRKALDAGVPGERIADDLGVRVADVQRMAEADRART
jgi:hypothetical protein